MGIRKATEKYEAWLSRQISIVETDRQLKRQRMREGPFPFLRATFYRWAQIWPVICTELAAARPFWRWAICTSRTSAPGAMPRGG